MTDQLSLYNGALRILGEGKLASLTEDRGPRHLLDDAWNDGARKACLEMGDWNFALRTRKATYDPDVTPDFGFRYAFSKPTDWVRTAGLASDEYFYNPLTDLQYKDEAGYWWADLQTIYISYVSTDASYGYDYSLWPESFTLFVQAYLAREIAPRIRQSQTKREEIELAYADAKKEALNKDAMASGAKFFPEGAWAGARGGNWGRGRRDRGARGRLTG